MRGRLQALGVLRDSGHEHLRGSLVVPILDADGRVVNLYGRKIGDSLRKGTPDHLYLPGPHRGVFNRAALASNEVILAESLIDAMTFWSAGWRHVTSSYGAGGFTAELLEALVEHGVERVLIAYDRDDAGDKSAASVAKQLAARGIGAYRVKFPKGMDANQYAQTVRPATKSLGAMLRAAEWMAGGSALHRDVLKDWPAPVLPPPASASSSSAAETKTPPPIVADLPEPTTTW